MTRLIQCKEHGPGPAAAMCRHLMEDPSRQWVEVPADPELGDDFRDWRMPAVRQAGRRGPNRRGRPVLGLHAARTGASGGFAAGRPLRPWTMTTWPWSPSTRPRRSGGTSWPGPADLEAARAELATARRRAAKAAEIAELEAELRRLAEIAAAVEAAARQLGQRTQGGGRRPEVERATRRGTSPSHRPGRRTRDLYLRAAGLPIGGDRRWVVPSAQDGDDRRSGCPSYHRP